METTALPVINKLLVKIDRENGARGLAKDFLCAITETLEGYQGSKSHKDLMLLCLNMHNILLGCRPRMAHIVHDIQTLILFLVDKPEADLESLKSFIADMRARRRKAIRSSIDISLNLFEKETSILLHSYSLSVEQILEAAKEHPHRPSVYVAAQEPGRTNRLIKFLQKKQIPIPCCF